MSPQIFLFLLTIATYTDQARIITTLKYSTFRVSPKIVHGSPVSKGQVPYLVSIKEPSVNVSQAKKLWTNLCGGSIITPSKGRTSTSDKSQWRIMSKVVLHQNFNFPLNDIALVFVDTPFVFSETVNYVIPARAITDYPKTCIAAGFGETQHGSNTSRKLLWTDISVLSRAQCDFWWEMEMNDFICTNSQASDVGAGDSGGPLACYGTTDPTEQKGKDLLVGIVSGKNFDKTTLFTRVAAFDTWLQNEGQTSIACICKPSKIVLSFAIILSYIRLLILFIFWS
ncbi:hypothetical protein HF086_006050 [Spodoptera exigua]|uniref:Peptidase S1 domain-containing protein n=1 Tax=Spodoptera exigua TaxID=7107 RepID=A0A922MXB5_SPOEX|nr:hypothetical protein HF086_006050 [Spodoptera exigua]